MRTLHIVEWIFGVCTVASLVIGSCSCIQNPTINPPKIEVNTDGMPAPQIDVHIPENKQPTEVHVHVKTRAEIREERRRRRRDGEIGDAEFFAEEAADTDLENESEKGEPR